MEPSEPPSQDNITWQVICGPEQVDLFGLLCVWDGERDEIGNLVYSVVREAMQVRLEGLHQRDDQLMPVSYQILCAEEALKNATKILRLFGFSGKLEFVNDWRERETNLLGARAHETGDGQSPVPCLCGRVNLPAQRLLQPCYGYCVRQVIRVLAMNAFLFSFTDWADTSRQYSVEWWLGQSTDMELHFPINLETRERVSFYRTDGWLALSFEGLVRTLTPCLSSREQLVDPVGPNRDVRVLGVDVDGTLLIRRHVLDMSVAPGPVLLIRRERFSLCGDPKAFLQEKEDWKSRSPSKKLAVRKDNTGDWGDREEKFWNPKEEDEHIKLLPTFEASLNTSSIDLTFAAVYTKSPQNIRLQLETTLIQPNLGSYCVTMPCQHPPDDLLLVRRLPKDVDWLQWYLDEDGSVWTSLRLEDLFGRDWTKAYLSGRGGGSQLPERKLYYCAAGNDGLSQCILLSACHHFNPYLKFPRSNDQMGERVPMFRVFQPDCCLACTRKQVRDGAKRLLSKKNTDKDMGFHCIIVPWPREKDMSTDAGHGQESGRVTLADDEGSSEEN